MAQDRDPQELRAAVIKALGPSFELAFSEATVTATRPFGDWLIDDVIFTSTRGDRVSAVFLHPPTGQPPAPAVIYIHAHGNRYSMGRSELFEGRPSLQGPYGPDLAARGIAALCLDLPCFETRQEPDESTLTKALLWHGETLFGQMLGELRAGIDFLEAHPCVQPDRLGALGFSMGSTLAWWLAALDPRITATSALCSFADLGTLVATGAHDGHGPYMLVPGLLNLARSGQIAGLAAPRTLQICAGGRDWSTPPAAFEAGIADVRAAYAAADAPENLFVHWEPQTEHTETPAMRAAVLSCLAAALGNSEIDDA